MRVAGLLVCAWLLLLAGRAGAALPGATPPSAAPPALTDTLHLNYEDSGLFGRYFAYCFDPLAQPATGRRALARWQAGGFRAVPLQNGVLQGGFRQDRLWLRVAVVNTMPERTHFVWNLYSFVDSATLYVQPDGRGPLQAAGGASSRVVAEGRPFPSRALCLPFWLAGHARAVLWLRVENHAGGWYLPTDACTAEGLLSYEATYVFLKNWSWLLGLYVASMLLNLLLYALLRDPVHLWYGAYVLCATTFLLMEDGVDALLLPQWLYGLNWQVGEFGLLLLALACGLRIMALFVRLRQGWPRLYQLSWVLSGVGAGYALAYPLLFAVARHGGSVAALAWLNGGRLALIWLLLLGGASMLAVVAARGRGPHRQLALLYASTYLCFLLGTVQLLLNYQGIIYLHFLEPNSVAWGLLVELLSLSALLTSRFRQARRQNVALRLRHLHEREAATQRLLAAQDAEREALARELHDALAPGLTALHLAWQGRLVRQALEQAPPVLTQAHVQTEALLRQLRHDVRALSQVLLPTLPGAVPPPLPEALALLTHTLSLADDGPLVQCCCDPAAAQLPAPLQAAAYRIVAELLHNALRHAQAQQVRVQVRCHPGGLALSVEDDGQGFDPQQAPASASTGRGGLGLRGVQARAGYLRGQVQVSSRPGHGTRVSVELPAAF